MLQRLYRGLTDLGGPAIRLLLARRLAAGKEDPDRQQERLGIAGLPRPEGRLVWCHAASVGESLSILTLVEHLLALRPGISVLVTTGTVTSARLMAQRLPAGAFHQYVPVDRLRWVRRFLDHWRPDMALWVESEIWPNMLTELRRRSVPTALVNARMSARSFEGWRRLPGFIGPLLASFRLCLAQGEAEAERLRALGATDVRVLGNLKYSAPPLPARAEALEGARAAVADRPLWLFASSHPGEEAIAADVHARVAARHPGLLTVLAPRHPARGGEIAAMLAERGLGVARRSQGALPARNDAVWLADTMGEMGLFYRLSPVACVGGSFVWGGHNPVEPAQLGCAILYGPRMTNFAAMAAELEAERAALPVADAAALAAAVDRLLNDPAERARLSAGATRVAERNARVIDRVMEALAPLLAEAGVAAP
ncbi:3-deoxy-D-manno-octulosonic acid transferase [Arenibaculum pallidiluteum]|uniref:3-deoxy-D-manno-octulosonic acid transferase n=1 Tax=Arenibaculum pallidiluteum TaxID=2812559 RepID=UPI001A96C71B|nr:3-deoxy-D-manno-octulosonic acid transferase [Arenibaculum pallidiluteum]